MTTLKLIDRKTGNFVDIDTTGSGIINLIDAESGEFFELDFSNPGGILTVIDANSGRFVDIDFSNPNVELTSINPVTGAFDSVSPGGISGDRYLVDENTGLNVLLDFDD